MKSHIPSRNSVAAGSALAFVLAGIGSPGNAATFDPESVAPNLGIEVFNRGVAENQLGRQLFSAPYASVVIGNVDVYDVFPYVESRYFVIVSDPEWNRIVVTATGSGRFSSFDGTAAGCGPLHGPRGLAVDEFGHVYVCDTENDRIVVLTASPEFDRLELTPVGAIDGVSRPYGVAVSDAGTPFDARDDRIYVAESGRNQISRFLVATAVDAASPTYTKTGSIGGLGSGVGRFAGPMAVAVGRDADHSSNRLYVADAHNRRIVELTDDGNGLAWGREVAYEASLVTGLETDRWGQVYAVAPSEGRVTKFSPGLDVLAVEVSGGAHPRNFHVPVVTTTDHRSGRRTRNAEGRGLLVENWGAGTGVRALSLGLEINGLEAKSEEPFQVTFVLTDPAQVEARLESVRGEVLARRDLGLLPAGRQDVGLRAEDFVAGASGFREGNARWIVEAHSTYAERAPVMAMSETWISEDALPWAEAPLFQGSDPNPFVDGTALRFVLPAGVGGRAEAEIFDLSGRRVRSLARDHSGGPVDLVWDGRDDRGNELGSGIYFYRARAAEQEWKGRIVRIR